MFFKRGEIFLLIFLIFFPFLCELRFDLKSRLRVSGATWHSGENTG